MKILLAIALAAGVTACGDLNVNGDPQVNVDGASTAPGGGASAKASWPAADKNKELTICNQQVDFLTIPATKIYCSCIVDALEKQYEYSEFSQNNGQILKDIKVNGLAKECVLRADPNYYTPEKKQQTKLKKGMTKAEVKALFGEPTKVEEEYDGNITWQWNYKSKHCDDFYTCEVTFSTKDDSTVIGQRYILGKYIDLESF